MATAEATLAPEKTYVKDQDKTDYDHDKNVEKLQNIFDGLDFEDNISDSQIHESKDAKG